MSIRIIKANLANAPASGEIFNFVDLQRQGDDLISNARRAAEEILENARVEATILRENALLEAKKEGREEGLRDAMVQIQLQADEVADQRVTTQLATALPALRAAAASLQSERDQWLVRWEHTAVRLGIAIAEKLIQRQLVARPDFATEMIAEALELAAGQEKLKVFLHPADLAAWGDRGAQIVESLTACADAILVPDDHCIRGSCRIETRHGEIDARVETMLHRIADELLDD